MPYFEDMNSRLADIFESIVLESMEMIAAKNAAGASGTIKSYQDIKSFNDLAELYSSLPYELEELDLWRVLGFHKFEGPLPSRDLIDHRVRDGTLLASLARDSWTQVDREKAAKIKGILEKAKDELIQDLPRVLRENSFPCTSRQVQNYSSYC